MTDILAFGAHPDDVEFGCGGILAKAAAQGKSIVIVDLTLGEKGSHGTPDIRRQEGLEAAKCIGAKRVFLDFKDCEIQDNYESRLKLVKVLREYKPKLVLAPLWKGQSNHPDHIELGKLARYACRYARFSKILPEYPIHRIEGILHYIHLLHGVPDFYVDVTEFVDVWKKMIHAHKSQMETYPYDEWNLRIASGNGVFAEAPFAQGLIKGNPIIIDDIMTLSHQTREL